MAYKPQQGGCNAVTLLCGIQAVQGASPYKEYEVKDILDHRRSGRGYQYLVSWMGYNASKNQWLPE